MYERMLIGLDLGQPQDHTALALAQQSMEPAEPRYIRSYVFGYLRRWPAGTPYPQIRNDVACILEQVPGAELVVDVTACGRPVLDLFRYGNLPVPVRPVTISAGSAVTEADHGGWRVPKCDLVAAVQTALQLKRLKISAALREARTLTRELSAFRSKVRLGTGLDTCDVWRERPQDDLVLAVALAVWYGEQGGEPWPEPPEPRACDLSALHPRNCPEGLSLPDCLRPPF
jgi:hypothetical protein